MIFTFTFTFGIQLIVPVFKNLPPFQTVARHDDRPLKEFFFARSSLVFDRSKYWVTKLTWLFFCNFLFVNGPLALEEGLNRAVALTVEGYNFSNFDGSRLNFRAFNAYVERLLSGQIKH